MTQVYIVHNNCCMLLMHTPSDLLSNCKMVMINEACFNMNVIPVGSVLNSVLPILTTLDKEIFGDIFCNSCTIG